MNNVNTAEYWDRVWATEGASTWRKYPKTFAKILHYIGTGKKVLELGGGVGHFSTRIRQAGNEVFLIDISPLAIQIAKSVWEIDGVAAELPPIPLVGIAPDYIVGTEFLEHLDEPETLVKQASEMAPNAIFAVPDNRLGPGEEETHQQQFTEKSLVELMRSYYEHVEIESVVDRFVTGYIKGFGIEPEVMVQTLIARGRNEDGTTK